MKEYVGKICPFCKAEIKEDDEVVICSECDMPHHKSCWIENQGCTTFGCQGTIKKLGENDDTVSVEGVIDSEKVYCAKCGEPNDSQANFCCKCGNQLINISSNDINKNATYQQVNSQQTYQYNPNPTPNSQQTYQYNPNPTPNSQQTYQYNPNYGSGYYQGNQQNYNQNSYGMANQEPLVDDLVIRMIGIKSEYYVPKFNEIKAMRKNISWNWAAFFAGPFWMLYRRLYVHAAVCIIASIILGAIGLSIIATIGIPIAIGMFGNYMYLQDLEKKSNDAGKMNEPYKSQFLNKNIGVNQSVVIISVIVYTLLIFFLGEILLLFI